MSGYGIFIAALILIGLFSIERAYSRGRDRGRADYEALIDESKLSNEELGFLMLEIDNPEEQEELKRILRKAMR